MKISNYYTRQLASVMSTHRETREPITIKLSCGGTSTKDLTLTIDCIWALRLALSKLVFLYKKANPILKDGRFSINSEGCGVGMLQYVGRYCKERISHHTCYADAVNALNKYNNERINRL